MFPSSDLKSAASATQGFRADIQGLRAVAVLLVVVFHLAPGRVTGGYVGVDVFFVVSGFLITGLLLRRAERDGRVDFRDFYIRRARRLLPVACAALVVTGLACLLILPRSLWPGTAREIVASAFYVENIYLYFQGRDYLTAETAASPLQHYWSLSIEEQFYIVWPVLIALGLWAARVMRVPLRPLLFAVLGAIAAVSLYLSATLTPRDPGAYFLTTTRIWELALGGLLAIAGSRVRLGDGAAIALRWAGLAAILYSGLVFTKSTVFPGVAALVPTLGTLVLLLPDTGQRTDPGRLLSLAPMRYLGDISYSLYLWHWPIIVLGGYIAGGPLTGGALVGAVALMMALSHLSKYHLEDRFRHAGSRPRPGVRTAGLSAVFLGASCAAAFALYLPTAGQTAPPGDRAGTDFYPGALALMPDAPAIQPRPYIPDAAVAVRDIPALYNDQCQVTFDSAEPKPCQYGNPDAATTVALVGDSHAAQFLPTLQAIAERRDIRIVTHTKSSCAFIDALVYRAGAPYETCRDWGRAVQQALLDLSPDLVVTAKFSSTSRADLPTGVPNDEGVAEALARIWDPLLARDIPVIAIGHTPRFEQPVPDCMSRPGVLDGECDRSRASALSRPDHMRMAAERSVGAVHADLNDAICTADLCPAVVGNVLVYRDAHHLTATYARTLAPALEAAMARVLGGALDRASANRPQGDAATVAEEGAVLPADLVALVPDSARYPGALAIGQAQAEFPLLPVRPAPERLRGDLHRLYRSGCFAPADGTDAVRCEFGHSASEDTEAERASRGAIVVVGDSGTAHWMPALDLYAQARELRVVTYLKSGCAFSAEPTLRGAAPNPDCVAWADAVQSALAQDVPDLLVLSAHPTLIAPARPGESGKAALARGMAERLDGMDLRVPVAVIAQLPVFGPDPAPCLQALARPSSTDGSSAACLTPWATALRREDAMARLARTAPDVALIDLSDHICRAQTCHLIEGNVVVSKGNADITATYMRTLMPALGQRLDPVLGFSAPPG